MNAQLTHRSAYFSFNRQITELAGEKFKIIVSILKDRCDDLFVCVEVLRPSQPNGVMSSAVSLPNHTFTGQA